MTEIQWGDLCKWLAALGYMPPVPWSKANAEFIADKLRTLEKEGRVKHLGRGRWALITERKKQPRR